MELTDTAQPQKRVMRTTRYYQLSLLLPLVVPAVLIGPIILLERLTGLPTGGLSIPGVVDFALLILMASFVLAGLPYALFAVCALLLLWGRDALAYRRFAMAAPVVFSVFLSLWYIAGAALAGAPMFHESLQVLGILAIFVLPLGYLYVGLCFLGQRSLMRRGLMGV
jgi:hypothetical protein